MPSDRCLIAVLEHVFALEFSRVQAKFSRHDIHLAFVGEKPLRVAGRAHMSARHFVGVDHSFFDQTIGNLVRPRAGRSADQISRRLHRSVSAAIEDEIEMVRHDGAIFLHAGLHLDN